MFHALGTGLRQTLSSREVLKLQLPVPPVNERCLIVKYLDWKVSEINRFIHEKRKQIKMLEELKVARIDSLITKGTDSSVKMKNSGVEWLGDVPAHWNVDCIKQHFFINT